MKKENVKVVKGYDYPNVDFYIKSSCQNYSAQPKVWHTEDGLELTIVSSSTGEILLSGEFIQNIFHTVYVENTVQTIKEDDEPAPSDDYEEAARLYTLVIDTTERANRHIVFIP